MTTTALTERTRVAMLSRHIRIWHRDDCDSPGLTEELTGEDTRVACASCGRFVIVYRRRKPEPPGKLRNALHSPRPTLTSRWRCREHPDEQVTWRGTGCRACADEAEGRGVDAIATG